MAEGNITIICVIAMIIAFPFAFYFTGRVIFHMYKVVTNVTGKYASFLGAFLLFMPSQFNEEGNTHRVKLLKVFPWLTLTYVICFGSQFVLQSYGIQ